MTDLDLDCAAAATEVLTRGQDEGLAMAALQSALAMEACALTSLADHVAGEQPRRKPRRSRTIRAVYDADGVAIGTEDVEPVADIGPTPEAAPEPSAMFADVFGSIEDM